MSNLDEVKARLERYNQFLNRSSDTSPEWYAENEVSDQFTEDFIQVGQRWLGDAFREIDRLNESVYELAQENCPWYERYLEIRKFVDDICKTLSVTEPLGDKTLYETVYLIAKGHKEGHQAWHLRYMQTNELLNLTAEELKRTREQLEKVQARHERDKIKTDWAKFQEFEKSVLSKVANVSAIHEVETAYRERYRRCVFCGADDYGSTLTHKPDCVWITAKEFLEEGDE